MSFIRGLILLSKQNSASAQHHEIISNRIKMNKLARMLFFFTILKCTAALVFWDFSKQGCAARENLNEESFEDTPMTIIAWHSQACWSGSILPNPEDDVEIICDNDCGLARKHRHERDLH